jgi:hypothetical protein
VSGARRWVTALLFGTLTLVSALVAQGQSPRARVVRVSSPAELVRALGPERTLVLAPGTYHLADAAGLETPYVRWEPVYDGVQLALSDISGLRLRAEGDVAILAEPRYAFVLRLVRCVDVALEGLILGHTEAGYCDGGVLALHECEDVRLERCDLYGSGTLGVDIAQSAGVQILDSHIRECTWGGVWISDSEHVFVSGTALVENEGWPLLGLFSARHVYFSDCRIEGNSGDSVFAMDEYCWDVSAPRTLITFNDMTSLVSERGRQPNLSELLIGEGNRFTVEPGELRGEGYYDQVPYDEGYQDEYMYEEPYEDGLYDEDYEEPDYFDFSGPEGGAEGGDG